MTKKVILGMLLGILVELIFNLLLSASVFEVASANVLSPIGKMFINLIRMLVVPIVICSLILGIAGISTPEN